MHIPCDPGFALKFQIVAGGYRSVDHPIYHQMGDTDLTIYLRMLAQHQRAGFPLRCDDIAIHLTVYAQSAAEIKVAANNRMRADQRVDLGLWLAVFFAEHLSLLDL